MAGEECCVPAPPSQHDACVGKEETVGPFLSYVASPPSPHAAVILISDVFGFGAPLLRKLADNVAASGYFVVVPDFFHQDPYVPDKSGSLQDWIKNHQPMDVIGDARTLVEVLKSKGLSVGAVGFCWGAKLVAELAKGDCLKAGVFCHPSLVTVEDIKAIRIPLAILAAEFDHITPPDLIKQFEEVLKTKEVESFVHIYPGVPHGWTVRYDINDEKAVEKAEAAHGKILEWFGKFLH